MASSKAEDLVDTIRSGGVEDVRRLLDASPAVDLAAPASPEVTATEQTYLMIACEQTDLPQAQLVAQLLIDRGADVNARNRYGKQPIHYLADRGATGKQFKTLLAAGAELEGRCTSDDSTPLHFAARKKALDSLEFLLEAGADSHAKDGEGKDAMDYLSASVNINEIEKLENNKVPPRVAIDGNLTRDALVTKTEEGVNALDAGVVWMPNHGLLEQLSQNGEHLTKEDVLAIGKNGKRIATRAAEFGGGAALVKHLNDHDVMLGSQDLLDASGKPNDFLQTMVESGEVGALFTPANWAAGESRDMRRTYMALPPEGKAQVTNIHQLQLILQSGRPELEGIGR
ncbi:MAG: hypothetical protein FJX23_06710 [Alphaproteobacteria bacterium]|nr:hypothetical protein [Alphaproteobacteria bacterium]